MPVTNNEEKYHLVFSGQIKEGADLVTVKKQLKKFFNNKQSSVDQLFLRKKIILKKNLSKKQAEQYKLVFETTGAKCSVNKIMVSQNKQTPVKTPKTVNLNHPQDIKNTHIHAVDNSIKSNDTQAKNSGFNKIILGVLVIITLLVVSWAGIHFINSDDSTSRMGENKPDSNKSGLMAPVNYLLN
ncbi:MAG: hypothetical protein KZQ64_04440 [gamma proteobacterium symbiont of Bathyaustriella thionipta]|nr:hypothetical protein [gamma proteobacterium symbiont of Bathyaustriella thionipta]MCU7948666.1 hypothetical protein [gamma proteobacterium symbiont of Bathyaustriella thionipta]MCU7952628.1 hypothetical protein [gamma proteobacterium symbiont of Bathyaustriella thionipta]MCU7955125.1 hypothetical protein [gamma proteobacterium symbiont of Bathyaustriella thionipta]MCU7967177.1 hypothetical protein [gamma proteobacterium symbiont of Bathyaustriella thionipta]